MTQTRRGTFERVYDLTERVLPRAVRDTPDPEPAEAQRALLALAARSLGVATAADLRDYFRLRPGTRRPRVSPSWSRRARSAPCRSRAGASRPICTATPGGRAASRRRRCLSPFDPLIWERVAHRAAVRPALSHRDLHARRTSACTATTCCRSCWATHSRPASISRPTAPQGVLRVEQAHAEPGAPADVAEHLAAELDLMANWLGLVAVRIGDGGDLAPRLKEAVRRTQTSV